MKIRTILLTAAFCQATLCGGDFRELSRVHSVYIVGMSNALDQFLANRLTSSDVLSVVLDPAKSDAILTDKLDAPFWEWLSTYFPLSGKNPSRKEHSRSMNVSRTNGGVRGTVFLIDPRSSLVLWSTYERVGSLSPNDLDQAATHITARLKLSLQKK
jgi:hypothetical protein